LIIVITLTSVNATPLRQSASQYKSTIKGLAVEVFMMAKKARALALNALYTSRKLA
jgi:hypothetical protein